MRVNFPGYDGALPEQWPDCHCILWPFLGEDRWLQAWMKAGLVTKSYILTAGRARSLHARLDFAIVEKEHRLHLKGILGGRSTAISTWSNLANRQCPPARCRHR